MKKQIKFLNLMSATIIVLAIITIWLPKSNPISTFLSTISIETPFSFESKKIRSRRKEPSFVLKQTQETTYNLNNMLELMKEYRTLERTFFTRFQAFISDPNKFELLQTTLNKFKKERKNFNKCFGNNKKHNSTRYYFRIIENNIDGLEDMIEKIKIHSGQIKAQLEKQKILEQNQKLAQNSL